MKPTHAHHATSLLAGVLLGAGLAVSGMTRPEKVLGFLDPLGQFDASLLFVMMGAIGVHFVAYRYRHKRTSPLFSPSFLVPMRRDIDAKLLVGAVLFGLGWGLGGYCPGPALVSLPGGGTSVLAFVGAMVAGTFATAKLEALLARKKTGTPSPATHAMDASSRTQLVQP